MSLQAGLVSSSSSSSSHRTSSDVRSRSRSCSSDRFLLISKAYRILSNASERCAYDEQYSRIYGGGERSSGWLGERAVRTGSRTESVVGSHWSRQYQAQASYYNCYPNSTSTISQTKTAKSSYSYVRSRARFEERSYPSRHSNSESHNAESNHDRGMFDRTSDWLQSLRSSAEPTKPQPVHHHVHHQQQQQQQQQHHLNQVNRSFDHCLSSSPSFARLNDLLSKMRWQNEQMRRRQQQQQDSQTSTAGFSTGDLDQHRNFEKTPPPPPPPPPSWSSSSSWPSPSSFERARDRSLAHWNRMSHLRTQESLVRRFKKSRELKRQREQGLLMGTPEFDHGANYDDHDHDDNIDVDVGRGGEDHNNEDGGDHNRNSIGNTNRPRNNNHDHGQSRDFMARNW